MGAAGECTDASESREEGAGATGKGATGGGRMVATGERIGGGGSGGGVRGRLPGPDLATGVLGVGVLDSEFGTTLLITLQWKGEKCVVKKPQESVINDNNYPQF